MGCEAGGLGRAGPRKARMLPIRRRWPWSNVSIFASEEDHPGASRRSTWAAEAGVGEPRQKAGAGIQGSRSAGVEEGCSVRHLGGSDWVMERVRGAGSARRVGGGAVRPLRGLGWRESGRDLPVGGRARVGT